MCEGSGVQFTDASYHDVTSWNWNFGDGTILNGETQEYANPYHVFNQSGIYEVILTAGNSFEEVESDPVVITVLPAGAMDSPSTQGFEQDEFPSDYWFIEDGLNDGTWEVSDDASFTGENHFI